MSKRTLVASSVGIGSGKESTDGGGETKGEVGREEARFIKRLFVDFLSGFNEATEIFRSGVREVATEGNPTDSSTVAGGRTSTSVNGVEPDEEKDPTLCLVSI
jgi:hypothetical protein